MRTSLKPHSPIIFIIVAGSIFEFLTACAHSTIEAKRSPPLTVQQSPRDSLATRLPNEQKAEEYSYRVPTPSLAEGWVQIRNFGLCDLKANHSVETLRVFRTQLEVRNASQASDWSLDIRMQQMRINQAEPARPAFAQAENEPDLPFMTIPKGKSKTVDLFFLVPKDIQNPGDLQSAELNWQLVTQDRVVLNETHFATTVVSEFPIVMSEDQQNSPGVVRGNNDAVGTSQSGTTSAATESASEVPSKTWWRDPYTETPASWKEVFP